MRYPLILLCILLSFSSCKIFRSNLMLRVDRNYNYDVLVDSLSRLDYRIATNDAIVYFIFTNKGFKVIDLATSSGTAYRNDVNVTVESDGTVKMPLLGHVHIEGLTLKEAEKMLEEKYSEYYIEPFVSLRVSNKRVIIFPGNGGQARVLPLANNNTSVMEAIAAAGGILEDGKAYKVKLIRANPEPGKEPLVYLMDLSKISGLKDGNSIVQAGDIIYVEPRYRPLLIFTKEIAPLVTLVTSILILYQFSRFI